MRTLLIIVLAGTVFVLGLVSGGFLGLTGGGAAGAVIGAAEGACSVLQDAQAKGLLSPAEAQGLLDSLQKRVAAMSPSGSQTSDRIIMPQFEEMLTKLHERVAEH